ncbi:MAG: hypothetical protein ABSA63_05565 [Thermoplasmata archaeon]
MVSVSSPSPLSGGVPSLPPELSVGARAMAFFRAHPILCLALLTPGLPEYLSTSSPIVNLAVNPVWFFLQLAINVGQYTAGALLVREAVLRWHKGWGTVALLGLAYGITEEGLGDNTLFNSNHGADGVLGAFGRFAGVNWVWATGVLAFHMIYSIGLPIVLLGLALPSTRGRSLVGRRGVVVALLSLAGSTSLETVIVYGSFGFWMGIPLLFGSLITIAVLVTLAYRLPARLGQPLHPRPTLTAFSAGIMGFAVFPVLFLLEYGGAYLRVPAAEVVAIEIAFLVGLFEILRRGVGQSRNEYILVALAFGFVIWQSAFGILLTIGLPYNVPLVIAAVWFFLRLRTAYAPPERRTAPPRGAAPAMVPQDVT